jgi:hypothetical protein
VRQQGHQHPTMGRSDLNERLKRLKIHARAGAAADDLQDNPQSLAWTANRSKTRSRSLSRGLGRRGQAA